MGSSRSSFRISSIGRVRNRLRVFLSEKQELKNRKGIWVRLLTRLRQRNPLSVMQRSWNLIRKGRKADRGQDRWKGSDRSRGLAKQRSWRKGQRVESQLRSCMYLLIRFMKLKHLSIGISTPFKSLIRKLELQSRAGRGIWRKDLRADTNKSRHHPKASAWTFRLS